MIAQQLRTVCRSGLLSVLALLVTAGGLGAFSAWTVGTARMPFLIGLEGYLPSAIGRVHPRYQSPYVALTLQGGVATFFILMSFVGAGVEEAYLVLLDTTLLVYFLPYLYMFAAYLRVGGTPINLRRLIVGGSGLAATLLAMGLALVPPEEAASAWLFEFKVLGGFLLFLGVGVALYHRAGSRTR